ncbi:MAG: hypothetical protein K0S09_2144 [Sphingobacteriaceae bacterium]|jgi:quinol monooxygenase YgiN|nr:hypothetical protein [Sphingobacteriaceae bacterium]
MVTLILTHETENFQHWKTFFDAGEELRSNNGVKVIAVYNGVDNPNTVTIITEFPSYDAVKGFMANPQLKADMEKAGVKGQPDIKILNKVV